MPTEQITSSEIEEILRKLLQDYGLDLSAAEYRVIARDRNLPSVDTIARRFGSWTKAKSHVKTLYDLDQDMRKGKNLTILEEDILECLKNSSHIIDISNQLDRSPQTIRETIDRLKNKGYRINISESEKLCLSREPYPTKAKNIAEFYEGKVRFGVVADTQIGSKFTRIDLLNTIYDLYEKEEITQVYHVGDLIDGEGVFRGQEYELEIVGADGQIEAVEKYYPNRPTIKTDFITGNHDLIFWKLLGFDVGLAITQRRPDLIYRGPEEADIELHIEGQKMKKPPILRLFHPGGGSAYALSYKPQKIIESYQGGTKPSILLLGHYHKASYFFIRNIHVIQAGCLQDQTRFMRSKALEAHRGGWIVECNITKDGSINRFKSEFVAFF